MYEVLITSQAERQMKRLGRDVKNRIVTAILALAENPRPPGCVKVENSTNVWRVRAGDYRVGYVIDDDAQQITVVRVANRSEFYD